ncbi:MAG: hypothetical protein CM15mP96_1380 [Gammaproteobacteria bacterium]|nr:MAG: hypothetical protein CM15mP96_1380 [Gammaproteobacteria bacterium]
MKENGWLDKVTSMDQHQFYNHYSQKEVGKLEMNMILELHRGQEYLI